MHRHYNGVKTALLLGGMWAVLLGIGWVIAGATRPEQIAENARAADWVPTTADLAELDALFPAPDPVALF